jgi:hypothetical protein
MSPSSFITVISPIAIVNQNLSSLSLKIILQDEDTLTSNIGEVLNLKATGSPRIRKTLSVHLITIFGALSERRKRA